MSRVSDCLRATAAAELVRRVGEVRELTGLAIEADGPEAVLGEMCTIAPRGARRPVLAEVVALRAGVVTLMPLGSADGVAPGCPVHATGEPATIGVGEALLGRVIDGLGRALDGRPDPVTRARRAVRGDPANPMQRPRIADVLETGIRSIDALLTLGRGQRIGIFAGSGVGKSTLLGMVARHVQADVGVVALIGERGREVREFVDTQLGAHGLARAVVVAAAADQPAAARLRAAHAAFAIAEHFRDAGRHVLLTVDSMTRIAMARREAGLAAGEPPTARGYPSSVFAELPLLCERCGTAPSGGSITALLTVLVEGDDPDDPVADGLRAALDGHIVLARELAHRGHYPAIDVLKSTSRLMRGLVDADAARLAAQAVDVLAVLQHNRAMVEVGAYVRGVNPALDRALAVEPALLGFLRQSEGGVPRAEALHALAAALKERP